MSQFQIGQIIRDIKKSKGGQTKTDGGTIWRKGKVVDDAKKKVKVFNLAS